MRTLAQQARLPSCRGGLRAAHESLEHNEIRAEVAVDEHDLLCETFVLSLSDRRGISQVVLQTWASILPELYSTTIGSSIRFPKFNFREIDGLKPEVYLQVLTEL